MAQESTPPLAVTSSNKTKETCFNSEKASCPKFFRPQFRGQKWPRLFYGRLAFFVLLQKNPHAHKIPRFRQGLEFFRKAGWKCQFYFYGHGDFPINRSQPWLPWNGMSLLTSESQGDRNSETNGNVEKKLENRKS